MILDSFSSPLAQNSHGAFHRSSSATVSPSTIAAVDHSRRRNHPFTSLSLPIKLRTHKMDENMKQLQQSLIELEIEAEHLLLTRNQLVENDKERNGNKEALSALRRRARTTKTSVQSAFESLMKNIEGAGSKPLVKEICATCGNHDSNERTWMMFPGTDVFGRIPFHAAHTILETDQARLDYNAKKLHSYEKEKAFTISEKGALADKINPAVFRSLVTLTDKPK